jgi:cell division protein FtsN
VPFNDKIFKSDVEESNLNPLARAELEFNREQIDAERESTATEYPLSAVSDSGTVILPETAQTTAPATGQNEETKITSSAPVKTPAVKPAARSQTPAVQPEVTSGTSSAKPAVTSQTPARRAPAVVVEEYRYLIIIGSFQGEENALTMVEKLRREGFDPEVAGGPDGYLRVSAQSFPTLDEAKVVLEKLRKEYSGAWVYKSR